VWSLGEEDPELLFLRCSSLEVGLADHPTRLEEEAEIDDTGGNENVAEPGGLVAILSLQVYLMGVEGG
jgi:hypothetical protein